MKVESFWSSIHHYEGATLSSESQTVPDMSLSVRDILLNYRRGYDMSELHRNVIDTDDDIDDDYLDDIHDLVDLKERKEYLNEKVSQNLRDYHDSGDFSKRGVQDPQEGEPSSESPSE
ncbi:hypothetical protein [Dipodfec virus UOA04_Rod_1151]|nr:hypothetical protein [Dipodfec virus UOA04_Rod_1151]